MATGGVANVLHACRDDQKKKETLNLKARAGTADSTL